MRRAQLNSQFPTTRWTGILQVLGADDQNGKQEVLAGLCRDYWFPLYAFARRYGHTAEDAEDLTQGFFAYALEHEVFAHANPALGTLRTFLLKVFQRYMGGVRIKERAQKRGGGQEIFSLNVEEGEELYQCEVADTDSPESLFDRSWASSLLRITMAHLRVSEKDAGRERQFHLLEPFLDPDSVSDGNYETLSSELGLSQEASRQLVSRLRKKFRASLREQIASTLHEPDDLRIDAELKALQAALRG